MIPNGVDSIMSDAFYNCYNLTSVTIPETVTNIGDAAFEACSNLASIVIPPASPPLGTVRSRAARGSPMSLFQIVLLASVSALSLTARFDRCDNPKQR